MRARAEVCRDILTQWVRRTFDNKICFKIEKEKIHDSSFNGKLYILFYSTVTLYKKTMFNGGSLIARTTPRRFMSPLWHFGRTLFLLLSLFLSLFFSVLKKIGHVVSVFLFSVFLLL